MFNVSSEVFLSILIDLLATTCYGAHKYIFFISFKVGNQWYGVKNTLC